MSSRILVAYFSRKGNNYVNGRIVNLTIGNTEAAAKIVARLTGGTLFKIDPVREYSNEYKTCTEEAQAELRSNARPELKTYLESVDGYDTVVLCYPNWWGTVPMPVCTFLERYDFSSKTILPLCTNEGSGMGRSETDIARLCPGAHMRKGLAIQGSLVARSEEEIAQWLTESDLKA